jgi:hypothetical protein
MNEDRPLDAAVVRWLAREADRVAPRTLTADVAARVRTTPQRRRRPRWGIRLQWTASFAGLVAAIGAAVVVVAIAAGAAILRQPSAGTLHLTPSLSGTTHPSLVIRFTVIDGLYGSLPAIPDGATVGHVSGHGTFAMSGAATGSGTFTDDIAYTREGTFSVTRQLLGPSGTLELTATITALDLDFNMETQGTWQTGPGTGAWSSLRATGTMQGSQRDAAETWSGTVRP